MSGITSRALRLALLAAALGPWGAGRAAPPSPASPAPASTAKPAPDTTEAAARAAFKRGADLYGKGRYREAIAAFEEADRLKPSPALQFNVGQAREKLGDVPGALAAFARYLRLEPRAANRATVESSIRALESRLAASGLQMLHVTTVPPGAEIRVDDAPAGKAPLDAPFPPGRHALAVELPGHLVATLDVDLPRDGSLEVNVALEPVPEPKPLVLEAVPPAPPLDATRKEGTPTKPPKSWVGPIVAGSVAVVAAGAGLVMGLQARSAQNALLAGGNTRQQADALVSKAQGDATAANVLYGVAGAAAITGGILVIAF